MHIYPLDCVALLLSIIYYFREEVVIETTQKRWVTIATIWIVSDNSRVCFGNSFGKYEQLKNNTTKKKGVGDVMKRGKRKHKRDKTFCCNCRHKGIDNFLALIGCAILVIIVGLFTDSTN